MKQLTLLQIHYYNYKSLDLIGTEETSNRGCLSHGWIKSDVLLKLTSFYPFTHNDFIHELFSSPPYSIQPSSSLFSKQYT
jgi:hypothetical protein